MTAKSLKLTRPLVSFDLETTGLNVQEDRVVEISCIKIHPDGRREVRTRRLNPTIPISEEASRVHGIRNEDVADEPTFIHVAKSLFDFLGDSDLTGFNLEKFDLRLLAKEFQRADMKFPPKEARIIDSRFIFMMKEPRTLAAALEFYCNRELEDAHTAEADAVAAADVLMAQINRYEDLPDDIDGLHAFCHPTQPDWVDGDGKLLWRNKDVVLGFGKYRGRSLTELVQKDPDYLKWIVSSDFSDDVLRVIKDALEGKPLPQPAAA